MPKTESFKDKRLQIRINSESKKILERAAAYSNKNISDFILSHTLKAAEEIIEKHECITLSARDWEIFEEALVNPPKPNEKLKRAFREYSDNNE